MKSTTTATPIAYPPVPKPPACVQRSVEWLEASQYEVDYLEESFDSTLASFLNQCGLERFIEALERIEGIKVFVAPDLSPDEQDPESIAQVYALARRAENQVKAHIESLFPMAETALIQYSMEKGKVSLDTQSATVTLVRSSVDSPEVTEAKSKLKQAGQEVLKQSPVYQQMLKEFEQTKERFKGEQKTSIRVSFWEKS